MSIDAQPFPTQTVQSRPMEPVTLAPPPGLHGQRIVQVSEDGDGLVAEYASGLVRYRKEDGQFVAVWPTDLATATEAAPIVGAQLRAGRCLVATAQGELCILYAQTLALVRRISTDDLLPGSDDDDWRVAALGPAQGGVWLLLRGAAEVRLLRMQLASDDRLDLVASLAWEPKLVCRALCGVAGGVLVATEGGLIYLPESGDVDKAQSLKLAHACDRLWPSDDGRFVLATGHEARRISLIRNVEKLCALHMEGMFVEARGPHTGGWLVWDKQDPEVRGAAALSHPVVTWMANASVAVIGNEQGQCLLIDAENAKAVKLMTPPDQPVTPISFSAPDSLTALSGNVMQRIVMEWRFAAPTATALLQSGENDSSDAPAQNDSQYAALQRKSAPAWLGWAIGAAVVAALVLLMLLNGNSGQ